MMFRTACLALVFPTVLLGADRAIPGYEGQTKKVLDRALDQYRIAKSYRDQLTIKVDVDIETESPVRVPDEAYECTLAWAGPNRMALDTPMYAVFCDGKKLWQQMKQVEQYVESSAPERIDLDQTVGHVQNTPGPEARPDVGARRQLHPHLDGRPGQILPGARLDRPLDGLDDGDHGRLVGLRRGGFFGGLLGAQRRRGSQHQDHASQDQGAEPNHFVASCAPEGWPSSSGTSFSVPTERRRSVRSMTPTSSPPRTCP